MRVVVLAGGQGTRLQEETSLRPKPMVEIGGKPILWHIMKHYARYGFHDFLIALGYLGDYIQDYFLSCFHRSGHLTIDFRGQRVTREKPDWDDWTVRLIDTGADTMTGGRLKRLQAWLADGTFLATYGDGVADVDLEQLVRFHRSHGKLATLTAVRPPARFGELHLDGDQVTAFAEKPRNREAWINGGFFVLEPGVLDYLAGDRCNFEADALERLAREEQLCAFRHEGFWQCMDTLHDKNYLDRLWREERAPWRTWDRPRSVNQVRAA